MNQSDPTKRDHFAFGSGRRGCPGTFVAERSLAIAAMRILWAFDVEPAPRTEGLLDPASYRGDLPGVPGPTLPVVLTPRNAERVAIIDRLWAAREKNGDVCVSARSNY